MVNQWSARYLTVDWFRGKTISPPHCWIRRLRDHKHVNCFCFLISTAVFAFLTFLNWYFWGLTCSCSFSEVHNMCIYQHLVLIVSKSFLLQKSNILLIKNTFNLWAAHHSNLCPFLTQKFSVSLLLPVVSTYTHNMGLLIIFFKSNKPW